MNSFLWMISCGNSSNSVWNSETRFCDSKNSNNKPRSWYFLSDSPISLLERMENCQSRWLDTTHKSQLTCNRNSNTSIGPCIARMREYPWWLHCKQQRFQAHLWQRSVPFWIHHFRQWVKRTVLLRRPNEVMSNNDLYFVVIGSKCKCYLQLIEKSAAFPQILFRLTPFDFDLFVQWQSTI